MRYWHFGGGASEDSVKRHHVIGAKILRLDGRAVLQEAGIHVQEFSLFACCSEDGAKRHFCSPNGVLVVGLS